MDFQAVYRTADSRAEEFEPQGPAGPIKKEKGAKPEGRAPFPDKARSGGRSRRTVRRSDRQLPNHLR